MCRRPCKQCPFRKDSPLAYDEFADECLAGGLEPSCHAVVGTDHIFDEGPGATEHSRCIGHDRWLAGEEGFDRPRVAAS